MPTPNSIRPYSIPGFRIALVREPGVKLSELRLVGFTPTLGTNRYRKAAT